MDCDRRRAWPPVHLMADHSVPESLRGGRKVKRFRLVQLAAGLILLLAPAERTLAYSTITDSGPIVGGAFDLKNGQTYLGNLVAIGTDVTLEEGSTVEGNILLVGRIPYRRLGSSMAILLRWAHRCKLLLPR